MAGIPPIVIAAAAGASFPLPAWALFTLSIVAGVGALVTGLSAKDKDVHSTPEQVQAAGNEQK